MLRRAGLAAKATVVISTLLWGNEARGVRCCDVVLKGAMLLGTLRPGSLYCYLLAPAPRLAAPSPSSPAPSASSLPPSLPPSNVAEILQSTDFIE